MEDQGVKKKRIVTLGNGTGQGILLRGLKKFPWSITAIVGTTDNGGYSGHIRKSMDIPSPGDLRNCLSGMADPHSYISKLFAYRFSEGELEGISLGNLIIAALVRLEGSLSLASTSLCRLLGIEHEIIPVSDESTQICAQVSDGTVIIGEWEIMEREPKHQDIQRLFLQKPVQPNPRCLTAIKEADYIIIAPGSLRTGIISILLVPGIKEGLRNSPAKKVYVCNLMTQPGQTDNFSLSSHLKELYQYLPLPMDFIIANDPNSIPEDILRLAKEQGSTPVKIDQPIYSTELLVANLIKDIDNQDLINARREKGKRFRARPHFIVHDPVKLREILARIINPQETAGP